MNLKTVVFALLVAVTAWPGRAQDDLDSAVSPRETRQIDPGFAWPTSMKDSVISRITSDAIGRLAAQFYDGSTLEDVKFQFVPMDYGFPVLAIRSSFEGHDPVDVQFVRCEGIVCQSQDVFSNGLDEISNEFADFRGDGRQDFIAAQPIEFSVPGVMVFRVYRMRDGEMQDVSHGEERIAHRLAELVDAQSKEIAALQAGAGYGREMSIEVLKAQDQYARDDYQRVVLGNLTAGFQHGELWKNAADFKIRELAMSTFEAIASPEAIAELTALTKASDESTAEYAGQAIERVTSRRAAAHLDGRK